MKRCFIAALVVLLASAPITSKAVSPGNSDSYSGEGVSLRMTQPVGSVLNPGDEIGFALESDNDAYVIVFNIDTEGYVNLLYPARGERPVHVRSGDTYMIPDESGELLIVEGQTGVEFVFALAVSDRDDIDRRELDYLGKANDLPPEERYRIDGDPFIAANIIAGELVRGISRREGVRLDYAYFFINEYVGYPCYLCGECDGGQPDMDCAEYIITANFDEERPLTYPLRRAYEMIEPVTSPAVEDVDVTQATGDTREFGNYRSDDGTVNINFYPYNSEVYYETRESFTGAEDVNVYIYGASPAWYDPWYAGWYYYPTASWGFYWGWPSFYWGFHWGYWGGYYCSAWYWPRCYRVYDCWYSDYCYYDGGYRYRPERYKDRYRGGDVDGGRAGYKEKYAGSSSAFQTAYTQASKRDGRMKLASGNVNAARSGVKGGTSVAATAKSRGSYKPMTKTTRVQNSRSGTAAKYAYSQKARKYTPRTRSSYGVDSRSTGSRTRGTGTTTLKPRTPNTGAYSGRSVRSGKSRAVSKSSSAYRSGPQSRTRMTPKSRTSGTRYGATPSRKTSGSPKVNRPSSSSSKRSSKSTYKSAPRSSRPSGRSQSVKSSRSAPSRSSARSSGASRSSSGGKARSGGKGKR